MGKAKDLVVKVIASSDANRIIKQLHYSGKVVNNSQVHLGVFVGDKCGGAMQFGPSLDKRKIQGLVSGTLWNEFIELNRMAFADWLPRNGESRCIGYAMRWLRSTYPWLKWVVSFADGTQCGDGAIYLASGFVLTGIKKNSQVWEAPTGEIFSKVTLSNASNFGSVRQRAESIVNKTSGIHGKCMLNTGAASMGVYAEAGWKPKAGFQLRYIYFLDPTARDHMTVPILPFSEIDRQRAGMYKGKPIVRTGSVGGDTSPVQGEEGGSSPTPVL